MKIQHTTCIGLFSLGLLFPVVGHTQNFYKWVDANGSTHYTTTPPPKNAKKLGAVNTINDTPSGSHYSPPPATNNEVQQASPVQRTAPQPENEENNRAPNAGERITLPPLQSDPTENQPIVIRPGNSTL